MFRDTIKTSEMEEIKVMLNLPKPCMNIVFWKNGLGEEEISLIEIWHMVKRKLDAQVSSNQGTN